MPIWQAHHFSSSITKNELKKIQYSRKVFLSWKCFHGQNGWSWVQRAETLSRKCQQVFAGCPSLITNIFLSKEFFWVKKNCEYVQCLPFRQLRRNVSEKKPKTFVHCPETTTNFFSGKNFFLQFLPSDTSRPVLTTPTKFGQQKGENFSEFIYEK